MTEHVIGGLDVSMSSLVTNMLSLTTVVNGIVLKFHKHCEFEKCCQCT